MGPVKIIVYTPALQKHVAEVVREPAGLTHDFREHSIQRAISALDPSFTECDFCITASVAGSPENFRKS